MRPREPHARQTGPGSLATLARLAWGATISAAIGAGVVLLIFLGRGWPGPRVLAAGASVGVCIFAASELIFALFRQSLQRLGRGSRALAVIGLLLVGACAGWTVATGAVAPLLGVQFFSDSSDLLLAVGIACTVTLVAGSAFYTYERLTARLRESVIRLKEQEFAQKELELAGALQQRLLPPPEIDAGAYSISARHLPARFVAGDFYDVFHLEDGSVAIVVADVAGKGLGASLIMASVKAMVPLLATGRTVAATLSDLTRRLSEELGRHEFVALALARYRPDTGRVILANAGLPDPYLQHSDGLVEELGAPGPRLPLGVRAEVGYEMLETGLEVGDRLLMLTDGLPEARRHDGEQLGYEALRDAVTTATGHRGGWLDSVVGTVARQTGTDRDDDWTAVVLERVE